MSQEGLVSVARSVAEVKQVITSLSDDEWSLPSRCEGWTVKDLVAHLSSNFKQVVEPSPSTAEQAGVPTERLMDQLVEPRKQWSNAEVRDEYLKYCDAAVAALTAVQSEPLASRVIPFLDLGNYPMNQLADVYAFDHYCHLRVDLLAPTGPIARDLPPIDDALVGPAVAWMLTSMSQIQPELYEHLYGTIRLSLTEAGGGSWRIARDGHAISVTPGDGPADVTVTSVAHDFVMWGTKRTPWRQACMIYGDSSEAESFFNALHIV